MTPEGRVKQGMKNWLLVHNIIPAAKAFDALATGQVVDGWYYMPVQGMYSVKGIPDFIVCFKGRFYGLEAKASDGETTPNQETQLRVIGMAGGVTAVVTDASQLPAIFGVEQ